MPAFRPERTVSRHTPGRSRPANAISSRSSSCWRPASLTRRSPSRSGVASCGASSVACTRSRRRRSRGRRCGSRRLWRAGRARASATTPPEPTSASRASAPPALMSSLRASAPSRASASTTAGPCARRTSRPTGASRSRGSPVGSAGTRSTAEDAFLTLGLPEPVVNTVHLGFEVDFRWPRQLLVVEVDGPPHGRPYNRNADTHRDEALQSAGYTVMRFADTDVQHHGASVARRVREHLSVRPTS